MNYNIVKTKSLYPVSLTETKQHLSVDLNITDDDDYITNFIIKSACEDRENYIDKDIAYTTNTYTVYDFYDSILRVDEGNLISITDVSINGTLYTDYELQKFDDHFTIEWDDYKGGDDYTLTMHFITGYDPDDCPYPLKQGILMRCKDFYDVERSSYQYNSIQKNDAADRVCMKYRAIRW